MPTNTNLTGVFFDILSNAWQSSLIPLSLTIRPTNKNVNLSERNFSLFTFNSSLRTKYVKSTPITFPYPSTFRGFFVIFPAIRSFFTPSPSGIICVAQAQVSLSVSINIFRFSPFSVGHTKPVKVCTRTGTLVSHAAIMQSNPAFGVIECTIVGFSFRNTFISRHRDIISFFTEICLSIGTAIPLIPYSLVISFICSPGEDKSTTSYFLQRSGSIPLTKPRDCGTVHALIIFFLSILFYLNLTNCPIDLDYGLTL